MDRAVTELYELIKDCIFALAYWFVLLSTLVLGILPPFFIVIFFVDKDFRAKCIAWVLSAYAYVHKKVKQWTTRTR